MQVELIIFASKVRLMYESSMELILIVTIKDDQILT